MMANESSKEFPLGSGGSNPYPDSRVYLLKMAAAASWLALIVVVAAAKSDNVSAPLVTYLAKINEEKCPLSSSRVCVV